MTATPTLPWSWYTDAGVHQRELDTIFASAWVCAGPLSRLVPAPGTIAPVELADGTSGILTRDADGALRALRNVCRHRGARLVEDACTRASIQCPYHAWTYGLDGALRAAPRAADEGLDIASGVLDLVPLEVDV